MLDLQNFLFAGFFVCVLSIMALSARIAHFAKAEYPAIWKLIETDQRIWIMHRGYHFFVHYGNQCETGSKCLRLYQYFLLIRVAAILIWGAFALSILIN